MLHSVPRSEKSRRHLISRVIATLALLAAGPAFAKKKAATDPPPAEEAAPAAASDSKLVAPTPDTFGRVHFGPSSGANLGRVTVKAPESDKVQVFVEGRYFGMAPITIYSVPKGDYIVEGTFPDGKTASRPVSVTENEEALADLTGAHTASDAGKAPMFATTEISPGRLTATKAFVIGGAAALVFGVVFGILEIGKESDFKNAPNDQAANSIESTGKTYALLANLGYVLTFVGVVGAAICAYPMFIKPTTEKKTASLSPVFMLVPGSSSVNGAMALRF
jgi:hypothetical protein